MEGRITGAGWGDGTNTGEKKGWKIFLLLLRQFSSCFTVQFSYLLQFLFSHSFKMGKDEGFAPGKSTLSLALLPLLLLENW